MKNSTFKDKFISTNFVRPLYRVKFAEVTPKLFSDRANLVGDAVTNNVSNITIRDTQKYKILPGACEVYNDYDLRCEKGDGMEEQKNDKDSISDALKAISNSKRVTGNSGRHVSFSDALDLDLDDGTQETWLRVRPAPIQPDERIGSIVLRFVVCQLGITVFIIVWTVIWVAVIHSYEGPNEDFVNQEYVRTQNQLVVDLATELRMITPISPRWQLAITTRIEEARKQTMLAAGRGAKLVPGRYWDLAGTFLFTVYVMTALGFGAPVPQTVGGRCFALLYAVFAIPFHVYLMMQASTCAVAHVNRYLAQCRKNIRDSKLSPHGNTVMQASTCAVAHVNRYLAQCRKNIRDSKLSPHGNTDSNTNMEVKASCRRKKYSRLFAVLTAGHCVPIACVLYYAVGALIFGVGRYRNTDTLEVLMFPLQFTTNGGLASVESYFRILYGFYVEGAMALLTCSVAALRRYSGHTVHNMTEKYRLFTKG